jgi:hypothetical protein
MAAAKITDGKDAAVVAAYSGVRLSWGSACHVPGLSTPGSTAAIPSTTARRRASRRGAITALVRGRRAPMRSVSGVSFTSNSAMS